VTPTRKRGAVIAAAVAVAVLVGAVVIIVRNGGSERSPVAASTTTAATRTTVATPAPSTLAPTGTHAPAASGTTAAGGLAPFLSDAERADSRVKAAAAAVNARIVGDQLRVDQATAASVRSARDAVTAAGRSIPAGLAPDVLRAALLVQSDLVSRAWAMNPAYSVATVPMSEAERCLHNGSVAAGRYYGDLQALRSLAGPAPVHVAAPDSRAAEELAVRLGAINLRNSGCDSCGGYVATDLPTITFYETPRTDPVTGFRWDGTIGDLPFRADFHGDSGWQVDYNAC